MKRVLAYSSIAHAGFILTGIIALNQAGIVAVLFYLLVYGAPTVGAFGIVWLVRERSGEDGPILGEATHLSQWAGLGRTHPLLALTFALFLLSFAGIPLTAGFAGKFSVFSAAVEGGAWPLALIGVIASSVAVFFYVRIIVLMFFTQSAGADDESTEVAALAPSPEGFALVGDAAVAVEAVPVVDTRAAVTTTVVGTEGFAVVAIAVCALITIGLGVAPSGVLDLIGNVATFLP
jgi:NADH-quinone oxidoreductase subunit N